METFISTVVFILPGFLMYFWIQAFGVNPVTKHNATEVGAISALLWIPVSISTLLAYNAIGVIYQADPIWSLDKLKEESGNLLFLFFFLVLSIFISFILSVTYIKLIYPYQCKRINKIREKRGVAPFSDSSSVWDEVFGGNTEQIVNVSKIDKQGEYVIGEMEKVPRPFEVDKCFTLQHVDLFTRLVKEYDVPISRVFVDSKSGICIKIYDDEAIRKAYEEDSASGKS